MHSCSEAEQTFRLYSLTNDNSISNSTCFATSFCFGSKRGLWSKFTIYFLMNNESIYYLSPIIPHNTTLPSSYIDIPIQYCSRSLDDIYHSRKYQFNENQIEYFEKCIEWLQDHKGQTIAKEITSNVTSIQQHDSWIRTKTPVTNILLELQGPLLSANTKQTKTINNINNNSMPIAIVGIHSNPVVLVVFLSNGIAKIYIQVEDTTPQWHKTNNNNNSNNFTLIQYEQWNLGSTIKHNNNILIDTNDSNKIIIGLIDSICTLSLSCWLSDILDPFLIQNNKQIEQLPDLPPSVVTQLITTKPTTNSTSTIDHFIILNDNSIGQHSILVVLNNYKVLSISLQSSLLSGTPLLNFPTISTTTTGNAGPSFQQIIETLHNKFKLNSLPTVAGNNLTIDNPETVELLIKITDKLQQEYVNYIYNIHAEIANKIEILEKTKAQQSGDIKQLETIIVTLQQSSVQLQSKLDRVRKFQQLLVKRVESILQIIQAQQDGLSPAERNFHKELQQNKMNIPKYKNKIQQLQLQLDRIMSNIKIQQTSLTEQQLSKLKPVLEDEFHIIQKTIESVKSLKLELEED